MSSYFVIHMNEDGEVSFDGPFNKDELLKRIIAGGLCAEAVPDVAHLIRSGSSIDAEGRLRDDAPDGGNLDLERVRAYLQAAAEATR